MTVRERTTTAAVALVVVTPMIAALLAQPERTGVPPEAEGWRAVVVAEGISEANGRLLRIEAE